MGHGDDEGVQKLLIVVKAYPNPSKDLAEAACIAALTEQSEFVRLYPIPFRDLEDDKQFRKYQWISVQTRPARGDPRPETQRPDLRSLRVLTEPLPTRDAWQARRDIVLPAAAASLCDIQDAQKSKGTSLGLFRPAEVLDFTWKETRRDWTAAERQLLTQRDLFLTREKKLLEKIPFDFRFRFRCEGCRNKNPHYAKVIDWELAQQFRRLSQRHGEEVALDKIRDKWLGELCSPSRDTYFFTGNMQAHQGSFLVLGVFWPPQQVQPTLFG